MGGQGGCRGPGRRSGRGYGRCCATECRSETRPAPGPCSVRRTRLSPRLARRDGVPFDRVRGTPLQDRARGQFCAALPVMIIPGLPRRSIRAVSSRATRRSEIDVSGIAGRHSLVTSSTLFRTRKRCPQANGSCTNRRSGKRNRVISAHWPAPPSGSPPLGQGPCGLLYVYASLTLPVGKGGRCGCFPTSHPPARAGRRAR